MKKLLIICTLLAVTLGSGAASVLSQGVDDAALVDRALDALAALDDLNSLAYSYHWHRSQIVDGMLNENLRLDVQVSGTVINAHPGLNERRQIVVDVNVDDSVVYTVRGETRLVDGIVYVNGAYDNPTPALDPLPDGWVAIPSASRLNSYPGLATLNIQPLLQAGETDLSTLVTGFSADTMRAVVNANLRRVDGSSATLEDGTPAERVVVTLGREALATLDNRYTPDDPFIIEVFNAVGPEPVSLTFWLDADGNLLGLDYAGALQAEGLQPEPGATLNVDALDTSSVRITEINADPNPTFAPLEAAANTVTAAPQDALPWWNDRVFYEVFVRSFYDSDGDGIGDLRGLTEKLDYLNDGDPTTTDDLGVTGIWLMPIAQSPSYHGYDVKDYYTIEEDYGTNEDFRSFMAAAHERGIVVIVDLVLNHTSSQHPWFEAALADDPAFEDYYIWADADPGYGGPWGQRVWHPAGDEYYFGLFVDAMPDLNYANPEVTEAVQAIADFWLTDMNVDGFRLDAIRHLYEDGPYMENVPETLTWLEDFDAFVHRVKPEALTVGEIWDESREVVPYVGERVDIAFEFDQADAILRSLQRGTNAQLTYVQRTILSLYPHGQYAAFLTNHDQNRVMSQLAENEPAAKVAATLLLTNPGVPFVYYGEEVGMLGTKPDERIRTPMQWDDSRVRGGFTTATPWQIMANGFRTRNVAAMTGDPASLLSHYRALIHLRNTHPALQQGGITLVDSNDNRLYAYLRYTDETTLLILVNLSRDTVADYALRMAEGPLPERDHAGEILLGEAAAVTVLEVTEDGGFEAYAPIAALAPYSTYVIALR